MYSFHCISQTLSMNKKEHSSAATGQNLNFPLTTQMTLSLLLKYYEYPLLNFFQIELQYVAIRVQIYIIHTNKIYSI